MQLPSKLKPHYVCLQVYSASDSDFQFISGVKKHQQYSLEGIKGVNVIDNLEDISQVKQNQFECCQRYAGSRNTDTHYALPNLSQICYVAINSNDSELFSFPKEAFITI